MNEVDRRLILARSGDRRYYPVEGVWFAWYPVKNTYGKWRWLRRVRRFKALDLFWEYFDIEKKNHDSPAVKDSACS